MTVFIAHTPQDEAAASALEGFLERRGLFVEREDGARGFRPLMRSDVIVMLWSSAAMLSLHRLQLERRCLDAWAQGRLVLVKLDHGILPVGLRDLRAIDATFEPQRDIAWAAVVRAVQEAMDEARRMEAAAGAPPEPEDAEDPGAEPPASAPAPAPAPQRKEAPPQARAEAGLWRWVATGIVVLGAALGAAALLAGLSPILWAVIVGVVALAGLTAAVAVSASLARQDQARASPKPGRARREAAAPPAPAAPAAAALFVSYARVDSPKVTPIVAAITADGARTVWLDAADIAAGESWAGEIVRAIRGAERVLVMCSQAAFQSDHVKREVYLADRYRRPLTPVFLEPAEPPEDFEYFFAGVQHLALHAAPQDQHAALLAQALAAR